MTRPVTPLLYISHNKSELLELRKHVFIKDAHEGKNNAVPGYEMLGKANEKTSAKNVWENFELARQE